MRYRCRGFWLFFLVLVFGLFQLSGCGGGDNYSNPLKGVFVDAPVQGITYRTASCTGTTDAQGRFEYYPGETVTFSIGNLSLGSAKGAAQVTPVDIVPGGSATDQRVVNMLVFLQTLDEDGDLNNGIQINTATAGIVSANASKINFNQTTAAFQADTNITGLLASLNTAGVFTDASVRGARVLRSADEAKAHFTRATSERKIVTTKYGQVSGYADGDFWIWLGIPYAKPPVGELRFADPQDPSSLSYVLEATDLRDACPQIATTFGNKTSLTEDCLYLNIFRPKEGSGPFPVMVWIHGGAFILGHGGESAYLNPALVKEGVIVVTFNYRLGTLGFLTHAALGDESGNYGLKDQVQALKWVKENISTFGGDPDNVTIFGESAGGHSVLSLLASPKAKGLFHKAIIQSGGYNPTQISTANARAVFWNPIVSQLCPNAQTSNEIQSCLRNKSVLEILTAQGSVWPIPSYGSSFLPKSYEEAIKSGNFNKVPVIIGNNLDEGTLFTGLDIINKLYTGKGSYYETENDYRGITNLNYGVPALMATDDRVPFNLYNPIADLYLADYAPSSNHRYRRAISDLGGDWRFACNSLRLANYMTQNGSTVFKYWFADRTSAQIPATPGGTTLTTSIAAILFNYAKVPYAFTDPFSMGAMHSNEIQYIFGKVEERGGTQAQISLSSAMTKYWAQFAKSGSPTYTGGVSWNAFTASNPFILRLESPTPLASSSTAFSAEHKCACWNGIWDNKNMNSCQ